MQERASPFGLQKSLDLKPTALSLSRRTVKQAGSLSRLPVELLYNIVEHLRVGETACLSLTCRELYQNEHLRQIWALALHGHPHWSCVKPWAPELNEKLGFLKLIWLDLPNHSLCGYCFTFYKRGKPRSDWFDCGSCSEEAYCATVQVAAGIHLPWWCIRAVLDCDVRGSARDRNLNCITLHTDWQTRNDVRRPPARWLARSSVQPELSGGRLMTHACQRLLYTPERSFISKRDDRLKLLWARRAVRYLPVCEHLNRNNPLLPLPARVDWSVSEVSRLIMDKACRKSSDLRRCSACLADCKWTVCKHPEGVIEIILDTWRIMEHPRPGPWDSFDQFKARWSHESSASNLDGVSLVNTIQDPPKKFARSVSRDRKKVGANQTHRLGSKALQALSSKSLWGWLEKLTREKS
jgi:hypothetical protein